jgi:hypothetical protein
MKIFNESAFIKVSLASTMIFLILTTYASSQVTEAWVVQHDGLKRLRSDTHPVGFSVDTTGNAYVTGYSTGSYTSDDYETIKYDNNGNQLWVARYNGPGNAIDRPFAFAVDAEGNVYVTGTSDGPDTFSDYATIKYDASGNQLWVARYNGPGNAIDRPYAFAVDTEGNVYVTGESSGGGTSIDYATIKYDASGNQLWAARYNGSGNSGDQPVALVVDAVGNVYVMGESSGVGTSIDYATIKYDASGNQLWAARYNGPGNFRDQPVALEVDETGNVYVTGESNGTGTSTDYATIKYDASGNQLWVARYNGPGNSHERPIAIEVDETGNVYVTGESNGAGTSTDYATIKYDSSGNQLWVARYNGPGNYSDYIRAFAVDAGGNVYVTGTSKGSDTASDYATIKYDASGNQLWVARYNGPGNGHDSSSAMLLDSMGNVYITGSSMGLGTSYDFGTVKYDANGNQLWVMRYNGAEHATALGADAAGNVYVMGVRGGSATGYDVVKYDANGNEFWAAYGTSDIDDESCAIVIDAAGNIYVTGKSIGTEGNFDYATTKYNSSGNQIWVAWYNGPGNGNDMPSALAVDAQGNVYVTGNSLGTGASEDWATTKYDANGNEIWVARYGGPAHLAGHAVAVSLDAKGNIYVTGEVVVANNGIPYGIDSCYRTLKYDSNGNEIWAASYNGGGICMDTPSAHFVDGAGNVYVSGWHPVGCFKVPGPEDFGTVKFDTNGSQLWATNYNGTAGNDDRPSKLVVDTAGNVYVTGYSAGRDTSDDYATIKFDASGNQLWVARYNGPGNGIDRASALVVDTSGNVYVTGYSAGRDTSDDYATIKYDTSGNQLWVARYNGPGNGIDRASALVVDTSGNVYVTGESAGESTSYDYATISYNNSGDLLWVARYNGPGNGIDKAVALAIDADRNLYVTGNLFGQGTGSVFGTIKYTQNTPTGAKAEVGGGGSCFIDVVTNGSFPTFFNGDSTWQKFQ